MDATIFLITSAFRECDIITEIFKEILCQLESFKTAQVPEQIQWHEGFNTAQEEGKATRRCSSGVIYTLSQFLFWHFVVGHAHAHTHMRITRPSPVLTMQLKEQQMTACTFLMSVCVHGLSCVNASSRAQAYPVDVLETGGRAVQPSWRQSTTHRKMCVKESQEVEKKHTPALMDWSHGTEWSEHPEERKECTVSRTGKLRSSKRWLTLAKGQWSNQTSSALRDQRLVPCLGRVECLCQD